MKYIFGSLKLNFQEIDKNNDGGCKVSSQLCQQHKLTNLLMQEKNMQLLKRFFLISLPALIFISCEFSSDPQIPLEENFEYPLAIGNIWEYERTLELFNFRPDSLKNTIQPTRFVTRSIVEVINDTTLQDSIHCLIVKEKLFEEKDEFLSWAYYSNKPDGLYSYAYRSGGGGVIKPRERKKLRYEIAGLTFRSLKEASDYFSNFLHTFAPSNDTLIYHNIPRKILAYPPETGKKWTMLQGEPFTIHKSIVGTELVSTEIGNFMCYKIQWTYESSFADNILFYDYVCEKGLIKRSVFFNNVIISNIDSPDGYGYADTKEESILIDINIQN